VAPVSDAVAASGQPATAATTPASAPAPAPKPPKWPFGLEPPSNWQPMAVVSAVGCAVLLFAAVRSMVNMFYTIAVNRLVQSHIVVDLRARVYDKMQRLSFRFFDANASGSLINRVTGDVQAVRGFVDGVVIHSLILALSLVVYVVYMVNIHVGLTLACLFTTPLLYVVTARFSSRVRPAYLRNRELFDDQVLVVSENLQGIHVVKGFARQNEENEKFRKAARAVRDQKWWIFRQVSVFQPLISLLTHMNLVIMLAYGGYLVICHERATDADTAWRVGISIGQLLVFAGLLQQFSGQVQNIANIANTMQQSLTAAERVFEVLDTPVEVCTASDAVRLGRVRGELRFENVSMEYVRGEPVLKDLTLTVRPGQQVAILGATGSGKTTLLSLVPRFYDPTAGRLLLDGHDLRSLDVDDLRRNIGVVFQESFLFSHTVAANIAFGHPEADMAQIERSARIAAAHDFVQGLPQKYETVLREGGENLSGGQRQRLAIARALLLDPPILLFDDPTAAIDPNTEHEIMQAMENAMAGRTTLIVAHRLSTLARADFVIVLEDGRIVQQGTHEELMVAGGPYKRAAELQLADAESLRLLRMA
jgi:ATP-binding cassette subfamily B protein